MSRLHNGFKNPPEDYGLIPLIRLNDDIREEELGWQLEELKSKGIGGAYIYAEKLGGGIPFDYLSERWWEIVSFFVKSCKKLGMKAWIYDDEDRPSGGAGGRVANKQEFRYKYLEYVEREYPGPVGLKVEVPKGDMLFAVAFKKNGSGIVERTLIDLTPNIDDRFLSWDVPDGSWRIIFYLQKPGIGWLRDYDPDLLNEKAVKDFMSLTHRQYSKRFRYYMGSTIQGAFTDEPTIPPSMQKFGSRFPWAPAIPWPARFRDKFKEMKGYDIVSFLPLLYFDGEKQAIKVRCDFWEVISKLYEQTYFKTIYDWCEKNGIQSTGHLLGEESLSTQLKIQGGDPFRLQKWQHIPGMDWIHPFDKSNGFGWVPASVPKMVSSIAHEYGHSRVMSETFAASGWGLTFTDMKRMVDWQLVLGVNMIKPISYKYSLRGLERTKFYPPGISYQQPWWRHFKTFSDYVSRMCYLASRGKHVADVAILHPAVSLWANFRDEAELKMIDSYYQEITIQLIDHQIDFDYIDTEGLRKARIKNKKLSLGEEEYGAIILPPMNVIEEKVLDKIALFKDKGGLVISLRKFPSISREKGYTSERMKKQIKAILGPAAGNRDKIKGSYSSHKRFGTTIFIKDDSKILPNLISSHLKTKDVSSDDGAGIYFHHRWDEEMGDLYLIHNKTSKFKRTEISFRSKGRAEIWHPETGDKKAVAANSEKGRVKMNLEFNPYESYFVVFGGSRASSPKSATKSKRKPKILEVKGKWSFLLKPTMDAPNISWNFEPWNRREVSYPQMKELTSGSWMKKGLEFYSGSGVYEKEIELPTRYVGREVVLDLGKVRVAAEVWINDEYVGTRVWSPYSFEVGYLLKKGINTIKIIVSNTLANYYSQFEEFRDQPLASGGYLPKDLESGLLGPVKLLVY